MRTGWVDQATWSVALMIGVLALFCAAVRWTPVVRPLDGCWRVVGGSDSGQAWPAWMARARRITFTFAGDRATVVGLFGDDPLRCSVAFPSPNALDLSIDVPALRARATVRGIYARDGDRLRLCLNNSGGARPTAFAARRGDPYMDFRLERVIPGATPRTPADELAAIVAHGRSPGADRAALATRCLRLAEAAPDADEATVALFWAVCNAPDHRPALARLKEGLARADLTMVGGCLGLDRDAWVGPGSLPDGAVRDLIPLLLDRVRRSPDHPHAGEVLTWVCCMVGEDPGPHTPPAFAEAVRLIDAHAAESPDIFNVFFYLGVGRQPPWMFEHEAMVRRVAARNPHGHARAGAAFALATMVAESGDARQDEARDLYLQFVKEFEGGVVDPAWADLIADLVTQARQEAEAMLMRPLGGPAPQLEGVDLDGKPLRLADYRGKVVLLSFWATWCGPCLRLLPRERDLHDRMAGQPFALLGVNGDRIEKLDKAALAKHPIAWPSFRSARPGRKSIAQEWRVWGWPTLYLIDHEGVIRRRWTGTPTTGELEQEVERLVARAMNRPEPTISPAIPPKASATKAAGAFVDRVFREESKYAVWVPDGYDAKTPLPVVLFLHGSGQRGTDGRRPLGIGLGPALRRDGKIPPFLAVFPQAKGNWKADGADARRALAILDEVERTYAVDRRRVYLTGVSMGGEGVWSIAAAHPKRFAAIVPVCGGGDPATAGRIKDLPCWAFHGDADRLVPVKVTRAMLKALSEAGGRPLYQEYPGVDHNCWDRAYGDHELYRWLLAQRAE